MEEERLEGVFSFLMGMNLRVGENSPALLLPQELFFQIIEMVIPKIRSGIPFSWGMFQTSTPQEIEGFRENQIIQSSVDSNTI